jgi:hypothetical protein
MSSLLYYSISSDLTEDEIIEINKQVDNNREAVYLFLTQLPSNSTRKLKRLGLYIVFMFAISQTLFPCAAAVVMPLPPAINRLSPIEQDRILSNKNSYHQIATIPESKVDKIRLTNEQIKQFNNLALQLNSGSITMEEAILQLRGGYGLTDIVDIVGVIAFVIFINWYDSLFGVKAFQANPLPHQDPFGWLSGKYDSRNVGPSPSPTIPTRMRSTALQAFGPSQTQASTFNNPDGSVNLNMGYQEVLRRARFSENFNCSFDRFVELASEAGETTNDSMRAAISGLHLEADGIVSNVRRDPRAEANGVKSFDYLADGPNGETHLEIKGPVGSEIKKAAGLGPSVTKQGKKLGFKIKNQLNYWFNPENRSKVLVVNDLFDVPVSEKQQMESSIKVGLKGAHPILFINNRINR